MNPLVIAFAVVGGVWGVVADRIATRWPEHDEPELPGDRPPGWRTVVNGAFGAVALGTLPARFDGTTGARRCSAAWFLVLTLLLATDLDQRLLPSVDHAAAHRRWRSSRPSRGSTRSSTTRSASPAPIGTAIVIPLGMYLISIPFGVGRGRPGRPHPPRQRRPVRGARPHDHRPRRGAFLGGVVIVVAPRHSAGHPQDVHPVRPVPHHRGVLGRPRPASGEHRPDRRCRFDPFGHGGSMPPNLSRPGAVPASGRRITSQRSRHPRREARERSLLAVTTPA